VKIKAEIDIFSKRSLKLFVVYLNMLYKLNLCPLLPVAVAATHAHTHCETETDR